MELSDYARHILLASTLDDKLEPPPRTLTDDHRGEAEPEIRPARPAGLVPIRGLKVKVPSAAGMPDLAQRIRIVHALANHELQAIELFAWAILAFPAAPARFRRGLISVLADEQRHCRLYDGWLRAHGTFFGSYRVSAHFWTAIERVHTPLEFVSTMALTFENANLDFSNELAAGAQQANDPALARILQRVHRDEIRHVRFGWTWLKVFSGEASLVEAYTQSVHPPLGLGRARGRSFDREARIRAGMSDDFIEALTFAVPVRPGGKER